VLGLDDGSIHVYVFHLPGSRTSHTVVYSCRYESPMEQCGVTGWSTICAVQPCNWHLTSPAGLDMRTAGLDMYIMCRHAVHLCGFNERSRHNRARGRTSTCGPYVRQNLEVHDCSVQPSMMSWFCRYGVHPGSMFCLSVGPWLTEIRISTWEFDQT
jgi:hypothetical protein